MSRCYIIFFIPFPLHYFFRYNADMLDWPALPEVHGERVAAMTAMTTQHLYEILEEVGLELGYEPNRFGLWSLRKSTASQ